MAKLEYPTTPAIRYLRDKKAVYIPHLFNYEEKGGTRQTAAELKIDEHIVIKTLVMETDDGVTFFVLMHGDYEVSTKSLARILGVKTVAPCSAAKAEKQTGYKFGGTSPFGSLKRLPVFAESSIFELDRIFINGGKRGFILEMSPDVLKSVLSITEVNAAVKNE